MIKLDSTDSYLTSDSSSSDYSTLLTDYLFLNLVIFFVYVEVIYKNALFSPYLLFYYPYAGIALNSDEELFLNENGYI